MATYIARSTASGAPAVGASAIELRPPRCLEAVEQVHFEGPHHDLEVLPQRVSTHVLELQTELLRSNPLHVYLLRLLVPSENLSLVANPQCRPVRDARAHREDRFLLLGEERDVLRHLGPRAHDAHLARQDVDELRQFVEVEAPYDPAHPRDARVVVRGGDHAAPLLSVDDHGAELIRPERSVVPTDADGPEEYWPVRVELDPGREDEEERRQHDERQDGLYDVKEA